ncbi:MAG: tRNA(His) guanylyltransferase Thg1 family protein [Planctomycetes bacterium]|nr:tRNA(His) guanylyltransferase Thg1 family protein [Planctomycetota bacterium]
MGDGLGDRMKRYEGAEAGRRLMPLLPVLARLDGRAFHSFVRGLDRPFDRRLSELMIDTATFLVRETNAAVGYTQSDEITLAWVPEGYDAQVFFDGRVQKMTSTLAALCSAHFNRRLPAFLPAEFAERLPVFDCRVWNVPTLEEAANTFLWRELDAAKNSVSMAARVYYEHAELHDRSGAEMQELLWKKGVNWADYPTFFKRGTFVRRWKVSRPFAAAELEALPQKHAARSDPALVVERSECGPLDLPPLSKVGNRVGVLFRGEEPLPAQRDPVPGGPGAVRGGEAQTS